MSRGKAPLRLVHDATASPAARALLRGARDPGPTPAQKAALWDAIEESIALPGGGDGGGGGGEAPTGGAAPPAPLPPAPAAMAAPATASPAATWLGVGAAAGLSLVVAILVGRGAAPTPQESPRPIAAVTERSEAGDRTPGTEPSGEVSEPRSGAGLPETGIRKPETGEPRPAPETGAGGRRPVPQLPEALPEARHPASAPVAAASEPPRSIVEDEAAIAREARELLRAGQAHQALALLEQARVRFSGGVLVQERAALTIEALARSGQADRAAGLARAFLEAWPGSAHADRVRPWAR